MARYLARGLLFVDQLIQPGEEFTSDLPPGRNWEPLDDAAKRACAKRDAERGGLNAQAARLDPHPPHKAAVHIPSDWSDLSKAAKRGLAMKLGAPGAVTAKEAESFIAAEVERREPQAA